MARSNKASFCDGHFACKCVEAELNMLAADNHELRKIIVKANKLFRAAKRVCANLGDTVFDQDVWMSNYVDFTCEVEGYARLRRNFLKRKRSEGRLDGIAAED